MVTRLGIVLAALFTLSCEGNIGGYGKARTSADDAAADVMKATNPDLYAVATKYFPSQDTLTSPKRLSRLTRAQLDNTTKFLLPTNHTTALSEVMPRDALQTNYEYAANLNFNPANFTPYTNWVADIATRVRAKPNSVIDCAASNNSQACLQTASKTFVSRAFRGVTNDATLTRFSDFFVSSVAATGLAEATATLVDVTLTSSNFVFRDEVSTNSSNMLLQAPQLQNITYTLADVPPEVVALSLTSTPQTDQAIERVMATPQAREKLSQFFASWLEVKEPDEFTLAQSSFPEFTPAVAAAAVLETKTFLNHQLSKAAPALKDITQSTHSYVSETLASIYELSQANLSGNTPVDLNPAQRFGIFTQPAVIASHSGPTTTRLVKRGVFFTRKIMCLPLGNPPPGVNTTLPTTGGVTERQLIESVTNQPTCLGCHQMINPFGFMQEHFDATGKWRTTDSNLAIDASISVDFLDEGKFTANSPVDALKGFTRSLRFQQCFIRQLFRFYMGRDETPSDDPTLRKMFFNFANNDTQDIVSALRTLAQSSRFLNRAEAQ